MKSRLEHVQALEHVQTMLSEIILLYCVKNDCSMDELIDDFITETQDIDDASLLADIVKNPKYNRIRELIFENKEEYEKKYGENVIEFINNIS